MSRTTSTLYAVATTRGLLDLSTIYASVAAEYARVSTWKTLGGAKRALAKADEKSKEIVGALSVRTLDVLKGAHVTVFDADAWERHADIVEAPRRARATLQRYSAALANLAQLERLIVGGATVNGTVVTPADVAERRTTERAMWIRECSEWPLLVASCGGTAEQWWAWQVEAARFDALTGPEREAERAARVAQ